MKLSNYSTLRRFLLSASLLLFTLYSQSQGQNYNWHFGSGITLSFPGGGNPVFLPGSPISTIEGSSSISDINGNLLFYTDGKFVWDRNNVQMPNGFGLLGGSNGSSTQAALVVKQPGSNNIYYIFTVEEAGLAGGFRYSTVDMNLNAGFGDVVLKNILIHTPTCEKLAATYHCNGTDIWISTHDFNSNQYRSVLLTSTGIGAPVISSLGPTILPAAGASGAGSMKFSPDGTMAAIVNGMNPGMFDLLDFNNATGVFSNRRDLYTPLEQNGLYGLEFSPNNQFLYVSNNDLDEIHQYNVTSGIAATILSTRTVLGSSSVGGNFGQIQTGPDGKLYFVQTRTTYIGCILSPNTAGAGCNWTELYLDVDPLATGLYEPQFGLPTQLYTLPTQFSYPSNTYCQGDPITPLPIFNSSSTASGTFSSIPAGLSLNPVTGAIQLNTSSPGNYTILYTAAIAGSCTSPYSSQFNITITPQISLPYTKEAAKWYFGNNIGLNFLCSSPPSVLEDSQISGFQPEGGSSISDINGDLLFYHYGAEIRDRNHSVMPNGSGLQSDLSSSQGSIAVPDPANPNRYYLFTILSGNGGLYYSQVDMILNSGNGDVIALTKNTSLLANVGEQITAVENCDGTGTWVIVHDANTIYSFLVTASGISAPVVSSVPGTGTGVGQLTASPTGRHLALSFYNLGTKLYSFDNETGIACLLSNLTIGGYGNSFSNNGRYLYTNDMFSGMFQYDILTSTSFQLNDPFSSGVFLFGTFHLGPDGKLYLFGLGQSMGTLIQFPNNPGATCGLLMQNFSISNNGSVAQYGAPNYIQSWFKDPTYTEPTIDADFAFSTLCLPGATSFTNLSTPISDCPRYTWNFGDPASGALNTSNLENPDHIFSAPGTYSVSLTLEERCQTSVQTYSVTVFGPPAINITGDNTVCENEDVVLTASGGTSYSWTGPSWQGGGASSSSAILTNPGNATLGQSNEGWYFVNVTEGGCTSRDSIFIDILAVPSVSISNNPTACTNDLSTTINNSNGGIAGYEWTSNGAPPVLGTNSTLSYNPFAPDQIVVSVTDNEGCIGSASLLVNPISPMNISYAGGPFCTNGPTIPVSLTGTPGGTYTTTAGLTIHSATGEITPATSTPGTYTVTYTQGACSTTSNVTINAAPTATLVYPSANICGLATSFSPSSSGTSGGVFSSTVGITIDTGTGEINPSTSTPGTYTITYTIAASGSCPAVSDQFILTIDAPTAPVVSFSYDPSYCTNDANPLPVLAGGFTGGGTFSSSAGISINANTGLIDLASSTAGTYSITYSVSASSPCVAAGTFSTSVTLTTLPTVTISGNTTICVGEQTTLTASGASSYQWIAGSTSTSATITTQPGSSQTYTVAGTQSGCTSTASVLVNVLPVPVASVSGNLNICEGESVTLNAAGGNSYVWSDGQNTSAITISPSSTQNLYVVAINGNCTDTAFVTVNVSPTPLLSATANPPVITLGESSQLNASSAGSMFSWTPSSSLSCSSCSDPIASPNSSTTYLVIATNSGGCTATATVLVIVDIVCGEVFTPEAFSPNNDGNNDEWCVYGNCITELDVQIFDRWGNMVRRMSSASDCWNGEVNGKLADQGVFMFQLNAKLLNGETVERKGSIYLMK